jgi:hypothetical protein
MNSRRSILSIGGLPWISRLQTGDLKLSPESGCRTGHGGNISHDLSKVKWALKYLVYCHTSPVQRLQVFSGKAPSPLCGGSSVVRGGRRRTSPGFRRIRRRGSLLKTGAPSSSCTVRRYDEASRQCSTESTATRCGSDRISVFCSIKT